MAKKSTTTKKPSKRQSPAEKLGLKANVVPWLESVGAKLTINQEAFCQLVTDPGDLFGNATRAYAQAYGYDLDTLATDDEVWSEEERDAEGKVTKDAELLIKSSFRRAEIVCATNASRLLRNAKVSGRVRQLLNEKVLNDEAVDSRLAEWIMNDREPATSIAAIREYNKLKKRIEDDGDNKPTIVINVGGPLSRAYGGGA